MYDKLSFSNGKAGTNQHHVMQLDLDLVRVGGVRLDGEHKIGRGKFVTAMKFALVCRYYCTLNFD